MKKAPTISLELNPSPTNKNDADSVNKKFYQEMNSATPKRLRKVLKRLSPYSLTTIEKLFNYKPTKECDIESFQLKLAHLLFTAISNYELFQYIKENNIDIEDEDYDNTDFLYTLNHDRNIFEKHLSTNVNDINDLLGLERHSILEAIYVAKQSKKVPPVFFLSDELLFLFLNTDLPEDISFLSDYYDKVNFFLYVPNLTSIKIKAHKNDYRFYRDSSNNSSQEMNHDSACNNLILYANLTNDILNIHSYFSLINKHGQPGQCFTEIDLNDIPYNQKFLEEHPDTETSLSVFRFQQLCINILLYAINNPVFKNPLNNKTASKPKVKAKDLSSPRLLNPRYLTLSSFSPSISSSQSNHHKSSEPSHTITPHFRRGHWKRVAVGKGRLDRDIRWIKPTYVNAK